MCTLEICMWDTWREWAFGLVTLVRPCAAHLSLPAQAHRAEPGTGLLHFRVVCWESDVSCKIRAPPWGANVTLAFSLWGLLADSYISSGEEREVVWTRAGVRSSHRSISSSPGFLTLLWPNARSTHAEISIYMHAHKFTQPTQFLAKNHSRLISSSTNVFCWKLKW